MIDWTKPLELIDGTPVRLSEPETGFLFHNGADFTPDSDGDYWIEREDGIPIVSVRPHAWFPNYNRLCVHADGCEESTPTVVVRNRDSAGMTTKWGDPIECNGVRPDWLRDDDVLKLRNGTAEVSDDRVDWGSPGSFRLPAGHPAYVALARGFTPWSGGESAPDDWDGGAVLHRAGALAEAVNSLSWSHPWREGGSPEFDIIGYRKRVEYGAVHADGSRSGGQPLRETVEVRRMTEAEAADLIDTVNGSFASLSQGMALLRRLGLVQDESRAERFTRETGHAVTEAVEAALNWKGE